MKKPLQTTTRHKLLCNSQFELLVGLLLIVSIAIFSPSGYAQQVDHSSQEPDELKPTLYFGFGVGRSSLEPDTDEITGVDVSESEQTGVQLTLGADLNKWISVELHGADLGRAELSNSTSIGYREYGLSALVYLGADRDQLNRHGWTVFGRTGVGHLSNSASGGVQFKKTEGLNWILGAGAEFSTRNGFALRAEGIAFDKDVSYLQLGLIYRIGRSSHWLSSFPGAGLSAAAQQEKLARMSGKGSREPTRDDNDGDGILQRDDRCPDTPPGIAVGDTGCAVFNGVIDGLTFVSGSAELTETAIEVLNSVADSLQQIPESRARVTSHTDSLGDADANMKLSQLRALAVARFLVQRGIAKARLEARAFGELRPIDTNGTAAGRSNNRRVEIDLIAE